MDTLWRVRAEQQEMYSDMFDEFKMEMLKSLFSSIYFIVFESFDNETAKIE